MWKLILNTDLPIRPQSFMRPDSQGTRRFTPKALEKYYEEVYYEMYRAGMRKTDGKLKIDVQFLRVDNHHVDTDNLLKAWLDGCRPFFDDAQVVDIHSTKIMGSAVNGIVVSIWREDA